VERFSVSAILHMFSELLNEETSIAVSNEKEFLFYQPSKRINLKIKPGDPVIEGTITHKAIMQRQKVSEFINRDIYGIPYQGMAFPYFQDGVLIGCITAIFPALSDAKSVVTLKISDGWIPIPFSKVMYLEAKDRKTYVYGEEIYGTHKYPLNEFEYLLPKEFFIRCHRSYIVNVHFIKEIYPDTHSTFVLLMKNNNRIPVSQSYSGYFRKLLGF
jgi:DNA-binding LytR/AlgR family response regulator